MKRILDFGGKETTSSADATSGGTTTKDQLVALLGNVNTLTNKLTADQKSYDDLHYIFSSGVDGGDIVTYRTANGGASSTTKAGWQTIIQNMNALSGTIASDTVALKAAQANYQTASDAASKTDPEIIAIKQQGDLAMKAADAKTKTSKTVIYLVIGLAAAIVIGAIVLKVVKAEHGK